MNWPTKMQNTHRTGYGRYTLTPPLQVAWKFKRDVYVVASPIIVDERVYMAHDRVYALHLENGQLFWQSDEIKAFGGSLSPTFWEGLLFVGGLNYLFALDAATGQIRFKIASPGTPRSTPCVYQGKLCWVSIKGALCVADARTGAIEWVYDVAAVTHFSPSAAEGLVYFSSEQCLYALDIASGELAWRWTFPSEPSSLDAVETAVIDKNMLFLSVEGQGVYALNATTGQVNWHYQMKNGPSTNPCVADGVVYVASSVLHAIKMDDGQQIWVGSNPNSLRTSAPVLSGETIYIGGGYFNAIYACDRTTGDKIWEYQTGDLVFSTPAIASGKLLIGSHDGYLYCFEEMQRIGEIHS